MPTAQRFNALGRGNGFPFCLSAIDVSGFDYWVTLGGFKKTDTGLPTQSQIGLSLTNAMNLFWNINQLNASVNAESSTGSSASLSSLVVTNLSGSPLEPSVRVCNGDIDAFAADVDTSDSIEPRAVMEIFLKPIRMFAGAEFLGYGLNSATSAPLSARASRSGDFAGLSVVQLVSYINEYSPSSNEAHETDYTQLNSINFVSQAIAIPIDILNSTTFVDATAITAKTTWSSGGDFINTSAQITGIDFYTY